MTSQVRSATSASRDTGTWCRATGASRASATQWGRTTRASVTRTRACARACRAWAGTSATVALTTTTEWMATDAKVCMMLFLLDSGKVTFYLQN